MNAAQHLQMKLEYGQLYKQECCNCACWARWCMILWFVFGGISAVMDLENTGNTYSTSSCYDSDDICCYDLTNNTYYNNVTCDEVKDAYIARIVIAMAQCFVACVGWYGLSQMDVLCLCIPMIWSLLMVGVVIYFTVKDDDYGDGVVAIVIIGYSFVFMILATNHVRVKF